MKVLFIGGTGVISAACAAECLDKGYEVILLNRGNKKIDELHDARHIVADIWDPDSAASLLKHEKFDSVIDWIGFTPERVQKDFELFRDKTEQYIYISSASAYQKPPSHIPIKETEPLDNPYWEYSRLKIACENKLTELYNLHNFPYTIVRPSHTYDKTKIPLQGGYTTLNRMLKGKKIIIHGDGSSLWTLTHSRDFAKGFIGLIGNKHSIGEAYHITSDEAMPRNQICAYLAGALGVEPNIVHIPSDFISKYDSAWGEGLLGDKMHSMIFDNSKIRSITPSFKAVIPFKEGAKEIASYYLQDNVNKTIDIEIDKKTDEIITAYESAFCKWWEK